MAERDPLVLNGVVIEEACRSCRGCGTEYYGRNGHQDCTNCGGTGCQPNEVGKVLRQFIYDQLKPSSRGGWACDE